MLPRLSAERVSPSAWSAVHGHVGSSSTSSSWAARLAGVGGWVLAPALSLGDNGQGVFFPEISFPKHQAVFHYTLKSTLLHTGIHVKAKWEG